MSINNTRSENLIDLLFEYSPNLIFIHDLKGSIINMNKNLIKVLGYKSKENILKLQIKDILNYENKDLILSKFVKLILNKSKHSEYYFKTKKNAHVPVEGFGFPYKIGKLDIIVNISTVIHDKKKLQKELLNTKLQLDDLMVKTPEIRLWALSQKKDAVEILQKGGRVLKESEKKYREILESIKEGYFEVDLEGNLVFFNDSLCDILGYSPEELVGKNYRNFIELENKKLEEFINIDEIDGKPFEFELIKKNREKIYAESSLSEKQNTEGIVIGFYGLIRDVTKRKEAENKINRKLEFEKVISKVSSLFINPLNFDKAINASLEFMGKLSNASRSYLFKFNNIAKTMDNTHEWCAKGVTAEKENLQGLPQDMFPWWMIKLNNEEVIHITDVLMMTEEAVAEQDILQQQNIKSLLVLPLFIGNILSGFIGFDNIRGTGEWDEEDFSLLQITSEIIGSALKRREIEKKLKESEQDLKTLNLELEQRIKLRVKELRESERRYRDIIETTPALIQSVELNGSFVFINQTWLDMLGYTREEVNSLKLDDVIHPESQQHCQNLFSRIKEGESISNIHVTFITKDGKPLYLEGNANPYFSNDKVTMTRGIFYDVTERKKTEQKLKESEEKYRLITESANDLVCVINNKLELEYINEEAQKRIMGYSSNDTINQNVMKFVHPDDHENIILQFRKASETGEGAVEGRIKHKNGHYVWMEANGKLFKDKDGESKILIIIRDVTDRIIADQKLKKSEELYHKAYDQVNFYKDLFTHDINNILQTITSVVELSFIYLKDPKKLNKLHEIWNLVNSQVKRGNRLVLNVRRLSQIEYTQVPIQPVEVFSFLQEAMEFTQKGIQEKKINFQIDSPFKKFTVNANELLLDVFENILINATRYNDNPIIEILIKISKLQKDGIKFLKLEFIDNGIGISDGRKKIIFKKGYKKEKQSKGMGLGLSLVKKILEIYNGQIWVENKVIEDYTKGSNFIILIPENL
jgi:PAS domain S-box-containing protein